MAVVRNLLVGLAAGAVLAPALGCGREAATPDSPVTASQGTRAESLDLPPLPEWAPENPSPEFLRAAKVLKPMPEESFNSPEDRAEAVTWLRYQQTLAAGFEFFGTLTDEQVERFLSAREIRLPVRSLTEKQGLALDQWLDAWRDAMRGEGPHPDWLVLMYKAGAREDLSNVHVGFDCPGHRVHIRFWITLPNGEVLGLGNGIADI